MDEIQIFTCEYVTSNIRSTTYQKFLEHDRVPLSPWKIKTVNTFYEKPSPDSIQNINWAVMMESNHRYLCRFYMDGSSGIARGGQPSNLSPLCNLCYLLFGNSILLQNRVVSHKTKVWLLMHNSVFCALSSTSYKGKNRMAFMETAGVSSRMPPILLTYVSNEV